MKLHTATISIMLILGSFSVTQAYGTSSNNGIDWMKYCKMAPDFLVSEPCGELVDDNNELTSKGEKVLLCLGLPLAGYLVDSGSGLVGTAAAGFVGCSSSAGEGIVGNLLSKLLN
jgi:hypothetical protein